MPNETNQAESELKTFQTSKIFKRSLSRQSFWPWALKDAAYPTSSRLGLTASFGSPALSGQASEPSARLSQSSARRTGPFGC